MGWKKLKDHFRIHKIVHVRNGEIRISTIANNVIDVIAIDAAGTPRIESPAWCSTEFEAIFNQLESNPALVKELVLAPDSFSESETVFTYRNGQILEKHCEKFGWPNVTHDGCLMYVHRYAKDIPTLVRWAEENTQEHIDRCNEELRSLQQTDNRGEESPFAERIRALESSIDKHRTELASLKESQAPLLAGPA